MGVMDIKDKIKGKDIIIAVVIPILLCFVVPLILYSINNRLLLSSQRYYYDSKLIVLKRIIYIIIYICIFVFYSLRNKGKFLNYLVGFLICIVSIALLFIINNQILLDEVNEFTIGITSFSYFLVGLSAKRSDLNK